MKMLLPAVAITAALGLAVAPSLFDPSLHAQATVGTEPSLARLALTNFRPNAKLTVTSPAFKDGGDIPFENTQYRGNVFPGLSWTPGPADTKSYAVVMQDTDVSQNGTPLLHWTMFNIPAGVTKLDPGMTAPPAGANFGPNLRGLNQSYFGPRTPAGPKHHYHFQVFALGMSVSPTSTFDQAMFAIRDSVLAAGEVVGLGSVDPTAPPPAPRPAAPAAPAAK
jgi:Raf kinase inhibitor-like YbhB/YbcL family protein